MGNFTSLRGLLEANTAAADCILTDGHPDNPREFPLRGIQVSGTVLFADLPGFSRYAKEEAPEVCAYIVNQFFSWRVEPALVEYGGIIDKFIGDEAMIIFAPAFGAVDSLKSALQTAKRILEDDAFSFDPKIGIASGPFLVAAIGTRKRFDVSVIGHIVNLAARCVSQSNVATVKAATSEREIVDEVFGSENNLRWKIEGPRFEEFKNVGSTEVITIRRTTEFGPLIEIDSGRAVDPLEIARKQVLEAKKKGCLIQL